MSSALIVIDSCQIGNCIIGTLLRGSFKDIVVFIPEALGSIIAVLTVQGLHRFLVIIGIGRDKLLGSYLHILLAMRIEEFLNDCLVDEFTNMASLRCGRLQFQVHPA